MNADEATRGAEMDDATARRLRNGVQAALSRHNARLEVHARASKAALDRRAGLVLLTIREIWRAGHPVQQIENLRQVHCTAALNNWRQRNLSHATVAQRWNAMRRFTEALGKRGMLQRLGAPGPAVQKREPVCAGRITLAGAPVDTYRRLLDRVGDSSPTYWVARLEREVGLVREEALMTNLVTAMARASGVVPVSRAGGQYSRPIEVCAAKQAVLEGARDFVVRRGRERLCWPGLPAPRAVRRVSNAISYQLRRAHAGQGRAG